MFGASFFSKGAKLSIKSVPCVQRLLRLPFLFLTQFFSPGRECAAISRDIYGFSSFKSSSKCKYFFNAVSVLTVDDRQLTSRRNN